MRTYGQFSVLERGSYWHATAMISCNESMQFGGSTKEKCLARIQEAYDRGAVPPCAVPEEEWFEEVRLARLAFDNRRH